MPSNEDLLDILVTALATAGALVTRPDRRFTTAPELTAALVANDDAVTESLRPVLLDSLTGSQWTADEHGQGPMPAGDWWVVDPVGGNVNAIQGTPDWNIGVSLVRDGQVALAALHAPAVSEMFTAIAGAGAALNRAPVSVSAKTDLTLALTGTGQARPSTDLRSHIAPLIIAQEVGAVVTDLDGEPWSITSGGYVAAAPGVHSAALQVLGSLR